MLFGEKGSNKANSDKDDSLNDEKETVVLASVPFTGKYFKCFKDGHRKIDCPMLEKVRNGRNMQILWETRT